MKTFKQTLKDIEKAKTLEAIKTKQAGTKKK